MHPDLLTLSSVAGEPRQTTSIVALPDGMSILYRPLLPADVDCLAVFLSGLSPATRRFWEMESYDHAAAQDLCDSIARYDKFRMVAVENEAADQAILAIYEFAFSLGSELDRYRSYGIELSEEDTCRFGPCICDAYQNRGLGSTLMPGTFDIARRFGKRRFVLWGGVFQANPRAIHFYRKHGFVLAGSFQDAQGEDCLDMLLSL